MGFVTKVICWIQIFLMYISVLQGYDLLCPTALQWNIRALEKCHNKEIYFCLFDNLDNRYIEGCTGPNFDRSGNKQYYPRYFNREPCNGERFQPFKFWTNGSSDCVYLKTLCSGEGQVIYNNRTTTEDRTCGCDFKSGYAFVLPPVNVCFCDPAVEDCACFLKPCPIMNVLSPDYKCVNDSFLATYVYLNKCAIPNSNNRSDLNIYLNKSNIEGNVYSGRKEHLTVCLVITVSLSVAIGLSFFQHTGLWRMCTGNFCMMPEEKYFLRLTYLIMRVAHPVVRIKFDEEFHPSRLQEELVTMKMQIYQDLQRKGKKHISKTQWNQLYPREGPVTSRNFDIRLLLTLIRNRTKIIIGDELPLPLHKDVGDDLTRINYYRKTLMQNMNGKMSKHEFDDSWDTLSFAILRLIGSKLLQSIVSTMGSNTMYREKQNSEQHNQHDTDDLARLKDTVYSLHTFHLEDDRCYKLLLLLYKWTAMIMDAIINEYCDSQNISLENLLNNNRHDFYHKRRKFFKCSDCENRVFNRVFTENQWNSLYEVNNEVLLLHKHTEKEREYCPEVFTSKSNLSLAENNISFLLLLISHIKDLSYYVFTRMETERFEQYLLQHRHTLFHDCYQQQCCECISQPSVNKKCIITVEEWDILFSTKVESELPHCISDVCSCKFVPVKQLRITDLNIELLNKIGYIANCVDVLGNLRNKVFNKALSGIMDEKNFENMWEESTKVVFTYLDIIVDEKRKNSLKISIKNLQTCKVNQQMWIEYSGCIQEWVRHDIDLKQPINEMLTFMKIVLPGIGTNAQKTPTTRAFFVQSCRNPLNITAEETNYLRVVHLLFGLGLTALRVKFDLEFPPQELPNKLCNRVEDLSKLRKQGVIFPFQWEIMFPLKGIASSKQFDFNLMVRLLEHLAKIPVLKDQPDDDNVQTGADLCRLINFRREIMQSINGTLTNEEFNHQWSQICPAIVRIGGKEFKNICSNLEMTKNFLDTLIE